MKLRHLASATAVALGLSTLGVVGAPASHAATTDQPVTLAALFTPDFSKTTGMSGDYQSISYDVQVAGDPYDGGTRTITAGTTTLERRIGAGPWVALETDTAPGFSWFPSEKTLTKSACYRVNYSRSEERRVGKECRRLCRSRWSPYH
jgi:hypothetical protein